MTRPLFFKNFGFSSTSKKKGPCQATPPFKKNPDSNRVLTFFYDFDVLHFEQTCNKKSVKFSKKAIFFLHCQLVSEFFMIKNVKIDHFFDRNAQI